MDEPSANPPPRLSFDDLVLDAGTRQVKRGDAEIELPKLSFDLLLELARAAPNALTIDELMNRVWEGAVVSPTTVAKRVELLRQALGDDSQHPRYVALVRNHGYRLIPAVSPAPTTADGQADEDTQEGGGGLRPLAMVVFLGVVGFIGFDIYWGASRMAPEDNSVAVLPFVSMTSDPEDEHLADGLTEELSHALANVGGMKVAGRTSAFQFKGKNQDLRDVGEALGVAHVVEGSVRRDEDALRITAQLVNTEDGFHLWSQTYDREPEDMLEIQADIARSVAMALRHDLATPDDLVMPETPKTDPQTYALYLRARHLAAEGPTEGWSRAQALLEEVVDRDPNFAPGWNWLARLNGERIMGQDESYPYDWPEAWRRAREAAERAIAIDPDSGDAHLALGAIAWLADGDDAKAARLIQRALELEPNNLESINFANTFAQMIGRVDDAIALGEYLVARDPLCGDCRFRLARSYEFAGRLDEAQAQHELMRATAGGGHDWSLGTIYLLKGDPAAALASYRELDHHLYLRLQGEALALHDLGETEAYERTLAELRERWGETQPLQIAMVYAYVGDRDEAFVWIDRANKRNPAELRVEFLRPLLWKLHDDPRWEAVLSSVGRAPDQLARIQFEVRVGQDPVTAG